MRKKLQRIVLLLCVLLITAGINGCKSHSARPASFPQSMSKKLIDQRQLIRSANLVLASYDIKKTVESVKKIVKGKNGYFAQINLAENQSAYMKIVVPATKLDDTLDALKKCGTEIRCNVYVYDVTAKINDLDAVLKNKKALRDRLRTLLKKTSKVSEVLAVEKELTRLQIEIDKIEGSLKLFRTDVENSKITLQIRKHRILGPLGYLFKGLFWSIGKLFVISS